MADSVFQIGAVVDVGQLNSGFDESKASAQAYVENMNVMFDEMGGKGARAYSGISQASKEAAASVTEDQVKIAQATAEVGAATRENARAYVLVKNGIGDADVAAKLYAATLDRLANAKANLSALNEASGPINDPTLGANKVVSTAAQVDTSELSRREATATLELAAAKTHLKEVTAALAASDLDEATKQQAKAAALDQVREKEAALAAVEEQRTAIARAATEALEAKAAAEAEAAAAAQATREANDVVGGAARVDTSELSQREAAATLELAAAKANLKEVTEALATSDLDETTKQQAKAAALDQVREKEGALAAVQAERREITQAATIAAEEQAAAERTKGEAAALAARLEGAAGAAVGASAKRATAALLEKVAADKALKAATAEASNELLTEEQRVAIIAPAFERSALAAHEFALANEEIAGASHSAVSGVQATSGAIRTLEGNAGIRAVENFLAKTLGLGPAMQAIFPIIGALAFGKILLDIGEKIEDVRTKALEAAKGLEEGFAAANEKTAVTNDELRITSDRLQLVIDKMEGHPDNGLLLALDEARKMADQVAVSLRNDQKELAELLKQHDVTVFGEALSGVAATGKQHEEMEADQKELTRQITQANVDFRRATSNTDDEAVVKAAGERRDKAIREAYQKQITAYHNEAARLVQEQQNAAALVMGGVRGAQSVDNGDKIAAVVGRAEQLEQALDNENLQVRIAGQTAHKQELEQKKEQATELLKADEAELAQQKLNHSMSTKEVIAYWEGKKAAFAAGSAEYNSILEKQASLAGKKQRGPSPEAQQRKEDEQLLREIETGFSERQAIREQEPVDAAAYWSAYLGTFRAGTTEYKKIIDEVNRYNEAAHREFFKDVLRTDPQGAAQLAHTRAEWEQATAAARKAEEEVEAIEAKANAGVAKMAKETSENLSKAGDRWDGYWRDVTKGQEITAAIAQDISMAQLRALEASGGISRLGAAQVEAKMHAQEHTAALQALEAELAKLEKGASRTINPLTMQAEVTDPKQAAEIERVKNQIAQQKGKGASQSITDASTIQQEMVAPYKRAFDQITSDFNSTVLGILKGQESIAQGAKKMSASELASGAQMLLELGEKHLAHYLFVDLLHLGSATKKAAIDATSNTTQLATSGATNTAEVMSLAAVAAAAAFASAAATPVIGLALAPESAAAAYAATAAFAPLAAFEQGTPMVPRDGIAMLHQGEAVLSSPAAGVMREMMGGGSRTPKEVHLHLGGNSFGSADGNFKQQFNQHENHVKASVKRWMRDGEL